MYLLEIELSLKAHHEVSRSLIKSMGCKINQSQAMKYVRDVIKTMILPEVSSELDHVNLLVGLCWSWVVIGGGGVGHDLVDKNPEQSREPTTNLTHIWPRVWNQTQATLVACVCNHLYTIPAPCHFIIHYFISS